MTNFPRWTIADLEARYSLEPTLQDLFVEGEFDKEILTECLKKLNRRTVVVYGIDRVDVDKKILAAHGLTLGNKQRVIALAHELAAMSPDESYYCLVDKDLDDCIGEIRSVNRLIYTNYCSVESYFFNYDFVEKSIITIAKAKIELKKVFMASLVSAMRSLFAVRLARKELCEGIEWISPQRCMKISGGSVELDLDDYIKRLLLKGRAGALMDKFKGRVKYWIENLDGDPREYTHGHDFVDVICWIIAKCGGVKGCSDPEVFQRLLIGLVDDAPGLEKLVP